MTNRILICSLLAIGGLWFLSPQIAAGSGSSEAAGAEQGHGLDPVVLAGVAAMLIIAKLSGEIFERFRQPAVLGELIGGIFIGNLTLVGFTMAEPLKADVVINALAELGVIILLFEVGFESNLGEMLEVGWSSLLVAVAGVVTPFFLGWGVAAYFLPGEATLGHIFIGATLCATSVGITARVLKDLDALRSREARIIFLQAPGRNLHPGN
jgi:Kef-type K+ transport system membrane component KefB